jgi:hypothetical protein
MRFARLLLFATAAISQSFDPKTNSSSKITGVTNRLCNASITDANVSATIIDNPGTSWSKDGQWAMTITGGRGQGLERRLWYDTEGYDYADDVGIGIDVCALANFNLPLNAHLLGRNDSGDCSTVFSPRCIESLTSAASDSALKWTTYSSPPPYQNLTAGVLPSICGYIFDDLQETIEKECGSQIQGRNTGILGNFGSSLGQYRNASAFK